jgi:hypothetical protein
MLFDVENPKKVGEEKRLAQAGEGGTFGRHPNQQEPSERPHDSCLWTDFAGNATPAVTASAEGRDDAGNSRRDTAARTIATRRDGNAGAEEAPACQRRFDSPTSNGLRPGATSGEGGSSRTLKGNQAHGRHE